MLTMNSVSKDLVLWSLLLEGVLEGEGVRTTQVVISSLGSHTKKVAAALDIGAGHV